MRRGLIFLGLLLGAVVWTSSTATERTASAPQPDDGRPGEVAPQPRYATLDEAIARGDVADVQLHLRLHPDALNVPGKSGLLPLHNAILRNRTAIALLLLERGANPDLADRSRRTPLHVAVERGNVEVVRALLARHARANELDATGWTPLHHAAAQNQVAVAQALLAGGADVRVLSERGGTPLHEAAASAGAEMIRLLLAAGVDPRVVSKLGVTALDLAREYQNEAAIAILAPRG